MHLMNVDNELGMLHAAFCPVPTPTHKEELKTIKLTFELDLSQCRRRLGHRVLRCNGFSNRVSMKLILTFVR